MPSLGIQSYLVSYGEDGDYLCRSQEVPVVPSEDVRLDP